MAKGKILIAKVKSGFINFFKEIEERNRKIDMKSAVEECKTAKRYTPGDHRLRDKDYHQDYEEFLSDRSGGDITGSKAPYKDYCQLSKKGKVDCIFCSDEIKAFEIFYPGGLVNSLNRCLKEERGLVSKV